MTLHLFCENWTQRPAQGTQLSGAHLFVPPPNMTHYLFPYLFSTLPFPLPHFLPTRKTTTTHFFIVFYDLSLHRKSCGFACRPHPHALHTVRLHTSYLNLYFAGQLKKGTAETSMMILPCHAKGGQQNTIHQVAPVLGPLLHLRILLPVAWDQMKLPNMLLFARLRLSTLKNLIISSSCALNRQPCSGTICFLLRTTHTHTAT